MTVPVLIIDAGHGGKDNGGGSNDSFIEKEMNLEISLYQYERFKSLRVPVSITRNEDIYLSPSERTKIVRESNAQFCFSNHINAFSNMAVRGVETIHSIYSDGKLAKKIFNAIVELGMPERRFYSKKSYTYPGKDYYFMHRDTGQVETIIIEYGFATNKEDSLLLSNNWQGLAEAVVKCFCDYTGYNYIPPDEDINQVKFPKIKERVKLVYEGKEIIAYITTENKSFVEVKMLCDLIGFNVNWDGKNKTIILKRKNN